MTRPYAFDLFLSQKIYQKIMLAGANTGKHVKYDIFISIFSKVIVQKHHQNIGSSCIITAF